MPHRPLPLRVNQQLGQRTLASRRNSCKQANLSPSCIIYRCRLLPLTCILTLGVGGISRKNNIVEGTKSLPPATLSLSFSGLQELLTGISWTTRALRLKIPEPVLISGEASSPGASQTLSHLSLETPCEVGCGPRTEAQKGKET